ncbi:copper amine oxidase [Bacillus salipaludis]|uniref:Amine oxidase n=1 Tax=Bacillus salipaludis TaxID=2547811 RepID=A0AA90QXY3_9BACI|nr:primary-amine oxidase [Bacillus salipaludis]MDQ6600602.1 primary-amine oxidase [Bacillus salipaludis]
MKKSKLVPIILTTALAVSGGVGFYHHHQIAEAAESAKVNSVQKEVPYNPLNPLSADEINSARTILKQQGYIKANTRFQEISLKEPNKEAVKNWKQGKKLLRQASIIVMQDNHIKEGLVDLGEKKVLSWKEMKGAHGMILADDWATAQKAILASNEYKKALLKRGIKDFSKVIATPLTVGYFGPKDNSADPNKKLLKSVAYLDTGDGNFWGHPIENLVAVIDLDKKKVIQVQDEGVIPVPMKNTSYVMKDNASKREPAKPLNIVQPKGTSFHVNGNEVKWQNFTFHFRLDPRVGPVINTVTYNDHGKIRKIMYEGSLGGMTVPYGDPDVGWYFKSYMDSGEYGVGNLGRPLVKGSDVPANAKLFDATLVDYQGKPYVSHNVMGIFEREGGPEWTHNDFVTGTSESRDRRELVLRFITTVGNYDYIFDWVFQQNGNIEIDSGASGIEAVKAVKSKTMHDSTAKQDTRNGTLLDQNLVGVYHQHIFNFRLDMDVDGEKNSVEKITPKAQSVTDKSYPYRNSEMVVGKTIYKKELDAAQKWTDPSKLILVTNSEKENKQGYPTGYQIIPYAGGTQPFAENLLFTSDSYLAKRVGYAGKHVWVTPYNENELYPEGKYINQSTKEIGLGLWTQQNRPIENTDDVVWVTTGITHIPRAEEWPIMPTEWVSLLLKPYNFFDQTPTLDLQKPNSK